MKILVAEDDAVSSRLLSGLLTKWGHEVELVVSGDAAYRALTKAHAAPIAILDWMMPVMDGVEVCRALRENQTCTSHQNHEREAVTAANSNAPLSSVASSNRMSSVMTPSTVAPSGIAPYIILLTAKARREDMILALDAGADDYLTKPFDQIELRARLDVGQRIANLQTALAKEIVCLREALASVRQLQALLPICSYCKRVRDDDNYWQQVDTYIAANTDTKITHGICPHCFEKQMQIPPLPPAARPAP